MLSRCLVVVNLSVWRIVSGRLFIYENTNGVNWDWEDMLTSQFSTITILGCLSSKNCDFCLLLNTKPWGEMNHTAPETVNHDSCFQKQCTSRRSQGCRLKKCPEDQHMQTERWCLNNNPANYIIQTSALIQRYSSNQSQSFPTGLERTTVLLCVFCWMWPWTVLLSRRINKPSASRSCIMKYVAVRYVTPKQPSHCKQ